MLSEQTSCQQQYTTIRLTTTELHWRSIMAGQQPSWSTCQLLGSPCAPVTTTSAPEAVGHSDWYNSQRTGSPLCFRRYAGSMSTSTERWLPCITGTEENPGSLKLPCSCGLDAESGPEGHLPSSTCAGAPLQTAGVSLLHRVAWVATSDSQMAMPATLTDTMLVGPMVTMACHQMRACCPLKGAAYEATRAQPLPQAALTLSPRCRPLPLSNRQREIVFKVRGPQ